MITLDNTKGQSPCIRMKSKSGQEGNHYITLILSPSHMMHIWYVYSNGWWSYLVVKRNSTTLTPYVILLWNSRRIHLSVVRFRSFQPAVRFRATPQLNCFKKLGCLKIGLVCLLSVDPLFRRGRLESSPAPISRWRIISHWVFASCRWRIMQLLGQKNNCKKCRATDSRWFLASQLDGWNKQFQNLFLRMVIICIYIMMSQ